MTTKWNPAQYDKFKAQRSAPFYDLMSLIKPGRFATAVDLGCGTGELTKELFDYLKPTKLLGIDSSPEMLEKSAGLAGSGLRYELQDIAAFQPEVAFNLLFSNAALHWLPDHELLFPKILSWIRPGGQVAIQMPCNFDHPSHQVAASVASRLFPTVFTAGKQTSGTLGVDRYAELLFANGFEEQICRIQVYGHPMPSGQEVIEWTRGSLLTAYQRPLSEDEFSLFMETYRRELLAAIGSGPYFYAFKRVFIWGRKDE